MKFFVMPLASHLTLNFHLFPDFAKYMYKGILNIESINEKHAFKQRCKLYDD